MRKTTCGARPFFGNASADLAGEEWRDGIQITVKRPLAHYRIVATDVQEFLNKQQANGRPGAGEYEVNIIYAYFLVTHLDAVTGQPLNSGAGFSYTRSINLSEDMTECEPCRRLYTGGRAGFGSDGDGGGSGKRRRESVLSRRLRSGDTLSERAHHHRHRPFPHHR